MIVRENQVLDLEYLKRVELETTEYMMRSIVVRTKVNKGKTTRPITLSEIFLQRLLAGARESISLLEPAKIRAIRPMTVAALSFSFMYLSICA